MRAFGFALLPLIAGPALAEVGRADLFPSDVSCYLRYYDKEHLATHPAQRVEQILVGPDYQHFTDSPLPLRLVIFTKGDFAEYRTIAYCEDGAKAMRCQIEGDGGAFQLEPGRDGALKLTLAPGGIAIEGETGFFELDGQKSDDRAFLLPAVPADSCP